MLEYLWSSHRVIAGRTADKDDQQQPQDIDAEVAFAVRDALAPIIAALAALGVGCFAGACCVRTAAQCSHHGLPGAIAAPLRKVLGDGAFQQQIGR